jgi:hypothetical protein
MGATRFACVIAVSVPVRPIRRYERTAAIWKYNEKQLNAAAFYRPHDRQRAALKRMPLTYDCY